LLATSDNYHRPRKNTRYLFIIFTDICGEDRTSLAGDTGNLRCPPRHPPGKINLRRHRGTHSPATATERGTQGKGAGVTWSRGQGSASPGPDAGFLLIKFLGRVDAGLGVPGRGFPGDKNSIDEFFDVGCRPSAYV